jgi:predicted exporter
VSAGSGIHLLARYEEERRKGLGPKIAFETIILETGPAIVLASLTASAGFLSLGFFPFAGYREFGLVAGIGILFQLVATLLIFPAFFQLLQRRRPFRVYGRTVRNLTPFTRRPLPHARWFRWGWAAVLLACLLGGIRPTLSEDLTRIGLVPAEEQIHRELREMGLNPQLPILFPVRDTSDEVILTRQLREMVERSGHLQRLLLRSSQVLPSDQAGKLELFDEIRDLLHSPQARRLPEEGRKMVEEFESRLPERPVRKSDLPPELRAMQQGATGEHFVIAFPSFPPNEGREALRLVRALDALPQQVSSPLRYTGTPVFLGRFLQLTIPHLGKVFGACLLMLLALNWLDRGLRRSLLETLIAAGTTFAMVATLLNTVLGLDAANLLAIPFLAGMCFDGVVHIQHRYLEEGPGSLPFVLRETGIAVAMSHAASAIIFLPLALSSQPALHSIGHTMLAGIACSLLVALVFTPGMLALREPEARLLNLGPTPERPK